MIDLITALSSFPVVNDRETDVAFFRTHVPWVGSLAYLHIVYKPIGEQALSSSAKILNMPDWLVEFFHHQNGANLFSGAVYIFGVVPPGRLLNRSDPFSLPPFSIEEANSAGYRRHGFDPHRIWIGGYGFDGSQVCFDRQEGDIKLVPRYSESVVASWGNFESWITDELSRLSLLFDRDGKRLVDVSMTLPTSHQTRH